MLINLGTFHKISTPEMNGVKIEIITYSYFAYFGHCPKCYINNRKKKTFQSQRSQKLKMFWIVLHVSQKIALAIAKRRLTGLK